MQNWLSWPKRYVQFITYEAVIKWSDSLSDQMFEASVQTEQTAAQYTACVWLSTPNCGVWGKASALRRNCSRPVPTVQLLCVSLSFLPRACAERAEVSGSTSERMLDAGNFVHRARRTPLLTRTGSRTGFVIDLKQLEWLLHKSWRLMVQRKVFRVAFK